MIRAMSEAIKDINGYVELSPPIEISNEEIMP
jgi:hypothetical protein